MPLRFCVKSVMITLRVTKTAIWTIFEALKFIFVHVYSDNSAKSPNSKFRGTKFAQNFKNDKMKFIPG